MSQWSHSRLATYDRTPPPLFRQGSSAFSRLFVFSALALFLMVADTRFKVTQPLRAVVSTLIHPLHWLVLQPWQLLQFTGSHFQDLNEAQAQTQSAKAKLNSQALRGAQVEQLMLENARLRKLLDLQPQLPTTGIAAQVMYEAPDPFSRKLLIDKGQIHGIEEGSPVVDEAGVLGQVTKVYPLSSEVTLVIDRDHAIPVLNSRTGARSVAYGDPSTHGGTLELRFMAGNSDVLAGDLLTTSGVDGIYPPGLHVAKIDKIERRADSAFAKIHCQPVAKVTGAVHVLVVKPMTMAIPKPNFAAPHAEPVKKGGAR